MIHKIDPIDYDASLNTAYVLRNKKLRVKGFEELLCEKFNDAGIKTEYVDSKRNIPDEAYWVSYTGLWSWDMTLYLAHAEVDVFKGKRKVGRGYYHHRGTNLSLAPTKWRSARYKMEPLYDELLQNYKAK